MTTVCHIGAFNGRNAGDMAIQTAMHQMFPADWNWWTIDCQTTPFHSRLIAEINERADLVLVGGGGLFWDRPGDNSVSGWQWNIATADIPDIAPPLVVYACGWTQFPYHDRTDEHPEIRNSLACLAERADLFSVRNYGTARKLNNLKLGVGLNIDVIPDPAYFIQPEPHITGPVVGSRFHGNKRILACYADDRPAMRWQTSLSLAEFSFKLPANLGVDHMAWFHGPRRLADFYSRMDLVLGMRKHSLIIPMGQGVPVIGLGDMAEIQWILEDVGLGEWLITSGTSATEADELVSRALAGEQPAIPLDRMRSEMAAFNAKVIALTSSKVGV